MRGLNGRRIDIVNADNLWYTHAATEAVQKVELLTCARQIKPSLYPLVAGEQLSDFNLSRANPDYFLGTEVAVVEVCASRVRRTADDVLLHWGTVAEKEADAQGVLHEQHTLSETEEGSAFDYLCNFFPAVLFVTPLVLAPDLRSIIPARTKLRRRLIQYCAKKTSASVMLFDPMMVVEAIGAHKALTDNNHYSRSGIAAVRQEIFEQVIKLRSQIG